MDNNKIHGLTPDDEQNTATPESNFADAFAEFEGMLAGNDDSAPISPETPFSFNAPDAPMESAVLDENDMMAAFADMADTAVVPEPVTDNTPMAVAPEPVADNANWFGNADESAANSWFNQPPAAVEPVAVPIPEPVAVTPEPVAVPIPEPVAVTPEPVPIPIPEPEPVAVPIPEPVQQPIYAQPTPVPQAQEDEEYAEEYDEDYDYNEANGEVPEGYDTFYGSYRTTNYASGYGSPTQNQLTKQQIKEVDKRNKERLKEFRVSNAQIIKNYRNYSEYEKSHYRYIFGRRVADRIWPVFNYIILIGLAFVIMYPIMFMISNAIRPQAETLDPSIMWIPRTLRFENFTETFNAVTNNPDYDKAIFNTFFVNIGSSIIQVIVCALTGYGFARFKFKGRGLLFGIVILQMIVPVQVIMLPMFMQFKAFDVFGIINLITGRPLDLIGNPATMFIMAFFVNGIRAGLFVLLFRQFFRGLPKELEDAAYLDGCGPMQTFLRIMVPNSLVSFLTVFIFSMVWYWNETYITSLLLLNNPTIAHVVQNLVWISANDLIINPSGETAGATLEAYMVWVQAGCLMAITPLLIMYICLQKYFVEGVERSGIVG
ncbi:MAG: ABC transporter permease subunit [Oscillospiraceae bacterium]|nr:ABC transporter permease subunit [Oscillospiraceae bacterium]